MGVILDPSASENGLTARMGMDATKPLQEKAIRLKVPDKARETAQRLIASLKKS
jgi:3-polyprenyl-4-hydroxybenzoate decarboxylase